MSLIISQKLLAFSAQQTGGKPELIQALALLTSQEIIVLIHLADDLTAAELADKILQFPIEVTLPY